VCLGSEAAAANEKARRNYKYQLEKRERSWMQTLSMTNVEQMQYEQGIDASNLGLANVYSDIQEKHGELIDKAMVASQEDWKKFLAESKHINMKASGRLGRSTDRIGAIELGQYLKKGNDMANKLTDAGIELSKKGAQAKGQARQQQLQMFTNVAFSKHPDIAPPVPVMQNVGMAAFKDALSIGQSIATIGTSMAMPWSDRRLKENIKKIGESISGLGIYKFNYIGKAKQYIGAMADEVIKVVPEAAILADDGFYSVNYNLIDVDFKEAI
jgi:hypothetical protein